VRKREGGRERAHTYMEVRLRDTSHTNECRGWRLV
jgi:hypothetical protein